MVHSIPVISLFDSGASHCYIFTRFVMMHSISCNDMDTQWEISTGNGVITTSRVCKSCSVEVCERQLMPDIFMIDTVGCDVILGMTWLSKYHAVIDYRNKSMIFRILHQLEFQSFSEPKASDRSIKGTVLL